MLSNPETITIQKMQELVDKLNHYTKAYDEGHPEISDQEWDDLYFQLQKFENYTGLYLDDSPTQRINYQVVNKLAKVEHNHPMLSLDKTKSIDDVKAFIGNKNYIIMGKMDGLTCSLRYLNGKLVSAETRGNGLIGEDILHNALQEKNLPNKINYPGELIIDGEIICTYSDFKPFEAEYKNPRNFASGSIRLLDSKESASRNLSFIAWDCIKGLEHENFLSNKLLTLDKIGFTTVPFEVNLPEYKSVEQIMELVKNSCYNLPIDGLVIKYDDCDEYNAAGRTDHHFKGGLAYKFYDEEYETTLQNIEWTMGRTGILTPVAIFEPIDIDGTEVSRASLHNVSIMKELLNKPFIGQKVWVFKANQIIPQISKGGEDDDYTKAYLDIPSICPICCGHTELKNNDGVVTLYCANPQCEGKLINRLDHFCGKNGLDIKGLSMATLEKLIDWGWVSNFIDIYKLENYSNEWKNKAGFGEKSVERILEAIEQSKETTLDAVISAAGIPLIGRAVAKELCKYIDSYEDFRNKVDNNFDFTVYDGFGEIMAAQLLNYNYNEIDSVVNYALTIKTKSKEQNNSNLEGLIFCITGKVHTVKNRDELKEIIENHGGKVVSSMSSKVNYLINNDITSTSAKNKTAKENNIPIITEEEFQSML